MNEKHLYGAMVENGIIINTLVFDDEETLYNFGCLPLAPGQGIGDGYLTPEEWSRKNIEETLLSVLDTI